jgi:hypothetical protein
MDLLVVVGLSVRHLQMDLNSEDLEVQDLLLVPNLDQVFLLIISVGLLLWVPLVNFMDRLIKGIL